MAHTPPPRSARSPLQPLEFRVARLTERGAAPGGPRPLTAEQIGRRLLPLLASLRLQSLSLHNGTGELLWLSEGVFGPDEHGYVLDALDQFAEKNGPQQLERRLGDGQRALFLCARTPLGERCGLACVIAEAHSNSGLEADLDGAQIAVIMRHFSMLLAPPLRAPPPPAPAPPAPAPPSPVAPFAALLGPAPAPELVEGQRNPPVLSPARPAPPRGAPVRPAASARAAVEERGGQRQGGLVPSALQARRYLRLRPGGTTRRFEIDLPPDTPASLTGDLRLSRRVIEHLARERERYRHEPASFTVPLCASAVLSPSFIEQLTAAVSAASLPEGLLGFSLPSAAWSHESLNTGHFMQACAHARCFVTLDEFSLGRPGFDLLRLPALRCLKLDPVLVGAIGSDKFSQASVAGIVQVAHVLGLHCVATNAETPRKREWLAAAGIEFADPLSRDPAGAATRKGAERLTLDDALSRPAAQAPRA
jgi:EAL domain-containing protein (putative c-di-GMP-specific phosphodiesterase class I)